MRRRIAIAAWGRLEWGLLLAGAILALAGAAWIGRSALQERNAAFETDARIAHRVLSQRMVQHDAVLATLALLQPPGSASGGPEQRLPALYPQVLRVLRREGDAPWAVEAAVAAALDRGEAASRRQQRPALGALEFDQGRYWLVRSAEPASFALRLDLRAPILAEEWPLPADSPVRARLVHEGQELVLNAGRASAAGASAWRFEFAKPLAAESQPFEVRLGVDVGWRELPWGAMLAWGVATTALMLGGGVAWRQRSEQRRARELLRLGQIGRLNALGQLAAGIAHELNQPLTAVLANTGAAQRLLADDEPDLPTARHAMNQAAQQARRAADVLGRLRRLIERPEAGAPPQVLRLAPQIEGALDLLDADLRRLGVRPTLGCQPPTLAVQAEPVALEQILHNLLANALQALAQVPPAERRLEIAARAEDRRAVITVRDSGPGIAPEVLPRLFEPFVTTRAGADGLGLGLSLCETLATGMGGALSGGNAATRGAQFRLDLPLAEGAP
jgi:signal transduction histidine kinase